MTPAALRRTDAVAGGLLLVEAALLTVALVATGGSVRLPVTAGLRGASGTVDRVQLAQVDAAAAAILLLVLTGLARLLLLAGPLRRRRDAALALNHHDARWLEFAFTSSIRIFLIAQLNGVAELGALVPIYAITSGLVLCSVLQERVTVTAGHPLLPLCFGAALGIVPWGVIAFHQLGAGVVGAGPTPIVRVTTLVLLAAAFVFFITQWREQRRIAAADGADRLRVLIAGEQRYVVLSAVAATLFALLVVLGIALPSA
ncbi:heliorhodopsin HeR [uncultured Amnibacterium sp.]|uniref:heliorhodopsin HeR n=1 Tax=uncultured Amnibacterium sp. TaxID=1631851 RepID=UPI0035CB5EC6